MNSEGRGAQRDAFETSQPWPPVRQPPEVTCRHERHSFQFWHEQRILLGRFSVAVPAALRCGIDNPGHLDLQA